MGQSVAGQIRIDLLAETARFNAGMREAGATLGSFHDQVQKFDRSFNSQKNITARIAEEKKAWATAMGEVRKEMQDTGNLSRGDNMRMLSLGNMNARDDMALNREVRLKNLLPWGQSMRVELSREAALTAAAIGAEKQTVAKALSSATKDLMNEAAETSGFGGILGTVGKFAAAHPVATGIGVALGYTIKQELNRDALAREIKRESLMLGQSPEDTSRLHAAGFDEMMLARFQRSTSDQKPEQLDAFKKLGVGASNLSGKPLLQSLTDVAEGFNKLKSPADRASVAMHLFGRGGADVIATLAEMKTKISLMGDWEIIKQEDIERTKAWDHALKGASNTLKDLSLWAGRKVGGESGLGTQIARKQELFGLKLKAMYTRDPRDEAAVHRAEMRMQSEDYRITHPEYAREQDEAAAKVRADADAIAQAWKRAEDSLKSMGDRLKDLTQGEGTAARDKFIQDLREAGKGGMGIGSELQKYDDLQSHIKQAQEQKRRNQEYESALDADPRHKVNRLVGDLDQNRGSMPPDQYQTLRMKYLRDYFKEAAGLSADQLKKDLQNPEQVLAERKRMLDLYQKKLPGEMSGEQRSGLELKYLRDYFREAANLSAEQLRKDLQSPAEVFAERKRWLDKMQKAMPGELKPGERGRIDQQDRDKLQKQLGIKNPLGDYEKAVKELDEAYKNKDSGITQDQYGKRRKELRDQAVAAMQEDKGVSPIGAAERGSREAYSILANAMVNDPKLAEARKTNALLDSIDKKIGAAPVDNGRVLDL